MHDIMGILMNLCDLHSIQQQPGWRPWCQALVSHPHPHRGAPPCQRGEAACFAKPSASRPKPSPSTPGPSQAALNMAADPRQEQLQKELSDCVLNASWMYCVAGTRFCQCGRRALLMSRHARRATPCATGARRRRCCRPPPACRRCASLKRGWRPAAGVALAIPWGVKKKVGCGQAACKALLLCHLPAGSCFGLGAHPSVGPRAGAARRVAGGSRAPGSPWRSLSAELLAGALAGAGRDAAGHPER